MLSIVIGLWVLRGYQKLQTRKISQELQHPGSKCSIGLRRVSEELCKAL